MPLPMLAVTVIAILYLVVGVPLLLRPSAS